MAVSENICPLCKSSNELEAVVCQNCGTALDDPFMDPGARTKRTDISELIPEGTKDWSIDEAQVPESGIAVYFEGEFKPVHVDARDDFVIGRRLGVTSNISDGMLDLSPMGGYGQGVSRRHVVILRGKQGYEILDLGSVNGTWLNDERLVPQRNYPLASGSHLRLGTMRLFVLYQPFKKVK